MRRITITLPDELEPHLGDIAILEMLELGAGTHALSIKRGSDDGHAWGEIRHSRLDVMIRREDVVEPKSPWATVEAHFPSKPPEGKR